MKRLLYIFVFLSVLAKAQTPMFNVGKVTVTDYDLHYAISGNMAAQSASSIYYFTKRPMLAALGGLFTSALVSVVGKEIIYDRAFNKGTFSNSDIDADIRGGLAHSFFSFGIMDIVDKKRNQFDSLKFKNLAFLCH